MDPFNHTHILITYRFNLFPQYHKYITSIIVYNIYIDIDIDINSSCKDLQGFIHAIQGSAAVQPGSISSDHHEVLQHGLAQQVTSGHQSWENRQVFGSLQSFIYIYNYIYIIIYNYIYDYIYNYNLIIINYVYIYKFNFYSTLVFFLLLFG